MMIRTQPLRWTVDDPLAREYYSVYATDAFNYRPQHLTDERNSLAYEIMRCALSGAGVVVDQTALITLHRQAARPVRGLFWPSALPGRLPRAAA